jgi:hypothetical protein
MYIWVNGKQKEINQKQAEALKSLATDDYNDRCIEVSGFMCTRTPNHVGPHVAHGSYNNPVAVWSTNV